MRIEMEWNKMKCSLSLPPGACSGINDDVHPFLYGWLFTPATIAAANTWGFVFSSRRFYRPLFLFMVVRVGEAHG